MRFAFSSVCVCVCVTSSPRIGAPSVHQGNSCRSYPDPEARYCKLRATPAAPVTTLVGEGRRVGVLEWW